MTIKSELLLLTPIIDSNAVDLAVLPLPVNSFDPVNRLAFVLMRLRP